MPCVSKKTFIRFPWSNAICDRFTDKHVLSIAVASWLLGGAVLSLFKCVYQQVAITPYTLHPTLVTLHLSSYTSKVVFRGWVTGGVKIPGNVKSEPNILPFLLEVHFRKWCLGVVLPLVRIGLAIIGPSLADLFKSWNFECKFALKSEHKAFFTEILILYIFLKCLNRTKIIVIKTAPY